MNRTFSQIRKLFLAGLCICLLIGGFLFASRSALAISLPPGDYEFSLERPVPPIGEIKPYSPYVGEPYVEEHFPEQVFWGDTHLHTVYSFDAGAGGTLLDPETSYRFARGEQVTTDAGEPVQLSRPLDFLVVSDHTDGLGAFLQFIEEPPTDCGNDQAQVDTWHDMIIKGGQDAADASVEIIAAFAQGNIPECMLPTAEDFRTAWEYEVDTAEEFNDPGKFTAVIGYEWTALESGNNLHRNILFRDNGDKAKKLLPKTTEDGTDPELLWEWMQNYEDQTCGDVLAIPHNGNISNGLMFAETDAGGMDLTQSYAKQRQRWEPLYEVIQLKGASETHPFLSPNDEFANFEIAGWDNGNLDLSLPEDESMYQHEYARAALKNGLKFEEKLGTNPFKFGMVGSTDSHIAISAVEEDSFMGKYPIYTPSATRAEHVSKESSFNATRLKNIIDEQISDVVQEKINQKIEEKFPELTQEKLEDKLIANQDLLPDVIKDNLIPEVTRFGWQYGAAGYVGVWAQENTRESLFDAMERREVYATSGPRMTVRFFGGWDFTPEDLNVNPVNVGYAKGVTMGSDMTSMPEGKVPTFLVAALKDPIRANLDRIQIVKGWLDGNGDTQEKIYNVAWSDTDVRQLDENGKLPPVGSIVNPEVTDPSNDTGTVNTETAEWTNTIGATELAKVWTDPDFDPSQRAFYYARVLEIPTPRWTDYDKAFFPDAEIPEEAPLTLQERVYTSPIWYSPAS